MVPPVIHNPRHTITADRNTSSAEMQSNNSADYVNLYSANRPIVSLHCFNVEDGHFYTLARGPSVSRILHKTSKFTNAFTRSKYEVTANASLKQLGQQRHIEHNVMIAPRKVYPPVRSSYTDVLTERVDSH